MSRTYRNTAHANVNARKIKFRSQRVTNYKACEELLEEGFYPNSKARKQASSWYLNSWDDYGVSAFYETKYLHKKTFSFLENKYGRKKYHWGSTSNWSYDDYQYYFRKFEMNDKKKKKKERDWTQEEIEEMEQAGKDLLDRLNADSSPSMVETYAKLDEAIERQITEEFEADSFD